MRSWSGLAMIAFLFHCHPSFALAEEENAYEDAVRPSLREPGPQIGWFGLQASGVFQIGGGNAFTAGLLWEPGWSFSRNIAARFGTGLSFYRSAVPSNFLATTFAPTFWAGNFGNVPFYFEIGGGIQVWWDTTILVFPIGRLTVGWEFNKPLLFLIDRVHARWEYKHHNRAPMHEFSFAATFELF